MIASTTIIYGGKLEEVMTCLEKISAVSKRIVVANAFFDWGPSILGAIERVYLVGDDVMSAEEVANAYEANEIIRLN